MLWRGGQQQHLLAQWEADRARAWRNVTSRSVAAAADLIRSFSLQRGTTGGVLAIGGVLEVSVADVEAARAISTQATIMPTVLQKMPDSIHLDSTCLVPRDEECITKVRTCDHRIRRLITGSIRRIHV